MMTNTVLLSIWLVPGNKEREELKILNEKLANKAGTAAFLPHVTAFTCKIPKELIEIEVTSIKQSMKDSGKFTLAVTGVFHSPDFFKSIYLGLSTHPILNTIYRNLQVRLGKYGEYKLQPHMSLVYGELAEKKRMALVQSFVSPKAVTITEIGYIIHENWESEHRLVEKWRYNPLCQL